MSNLSVRPTPSGFFAVYRDKVARISQTFISHERALHELDIFQAREGQSERKCICCGDTFESDGPRNRMCNKCRPKGCDAMMADQLLGGW